MNKFKFEVLIVLVLSIFFISCSSSTTPTNGSSLNGTLYYNTSSDLHKIDLGTGTVTKIGYFQGPNVLSDGRILSVATDGLAFISADGAQKQIIVKQNYQAPFDITFDNYFNNPQLSPDKQSIAYDDGRPNGFVYVVDLSGNLLWTIGDLTVNSKKRVERPFWGKDGSLYVQGEVTFNNGIYKIASDFQSIKRIDPNLSTVTHPSVSPDGATIAFILNGDVWLMGNDGSNARALTTGKQSVDYPTWSPDGKFIACYGPAYDFFFVPVAGGNIIHSSQAVPNLKKDEASGEFQMDWK